MEKRELLETQDLLDPQDILDQEVLQVSMEAMDPQVLKVLLVNQEIQVTRENVDQKESEGHLVTVGHLVPLVWKENVDSEVLMGSLVHRVHQERGEHLDREVIREQ